MVIWKKLEKFSKTDLIGKAEAQAKHEIDVLLF